MDSKKATVDMYVGMDDYTWSLTTVVIPADTDIEDIEPVAIDQFMKRQVTGLAFVGVWDYNAADFLGEGQNIEDCKLS